MLAQPVAPPISVNIPAMQPGLLPTINSTATVPQHALRMNRRTCYVCGDTADGNKQYCVHCSKV